MTTTSWANFFHIYQPPNWDKKIIQKVVRESYHPLFQALKNRPRIKLTLNICGSLTEQLERLGFSSVLNTIKGLAENGQIEFTGSAKYHPILPLLSSYEMERQIQLNYDTNRRFFGSAYQPKGFFMPEMCYSQAVAKTVKKLGYEWILLDEISYNGNLGEVKFNAGYKTLSGSLKVIFRNRFISDMFFMDILKNTRSFYEALKKDPRAASVLITGFDGENLGHHNPHLLRIWLELVESKRFTNLKLSDVLASYRHWKEVAPVPASWASRQSELRGNHPYYLWNDRHNPIHQLQWKLTKLVYESIKSLPVSNRRYSRARDLLDQALASDQYWWAAASPWWSREIVDRGADKLLQALQIGLPKSKATLSAKKIHDQIIALVDKWQTTGTAEQKKYTYLSAEPFTRYFGGRKVT
ncbi:MAG: hypothetical protein PHH01_02895 [Patescibacteria group bacterium]|nr:hypothetical protein [Patescibacteria group bacterium]